MALPIDGADAPAQESRDAAPAALLRRGLQMLERPRPEDQAEAERLLRKALAADPGLAAAHVGLSRIATYLCALGLDERPQRFEMARAEAEAAIELDPRDPTARAALARAFAISDRLTPALEQAKLGVTEGPEVAEAHLALCVVERLRGELEAAAAACRRASELAPDEPRVLTGLAETLRAMGDYQAAMVLYGQAADLDHESVLPQLGAAGAMQGHDRLGMASRTYGILLERFPYARTRIVQGIAGLRVAAQKYEGAVELYESLEIPPNSSLPALMSLYGKGYALFRLDRAAEGEYFLSTVIERVPEDYDGPARGREILFLAYDDLVRYFDERGRKSRAEDLLRDAASRPLAPTRMARRLALRLVEKGDGDPAQALLERALRNSDRREDAIEIADTALLLARLRSSDGRKRIPPGSPAGEAIGLAADRIDASALGAAHYRMARAFALGRDIGRSLASLEKARAGGFLPAEQAASENDFAILHGRAEFRALLKH